MRSFFRAPCLSAIACAISGPAMAVPVSAPGPEIGDGIVGGTVAAVALLAFAMLPRLKRLLNSRRG